MRYLLRPILSESGDSRGDLFRSNGMPRP